MAHDLTENKPLGGMNVDAEARSLPETDYIDALNLRNGTGYASTEGTGTNVMGTLPVTTYLCPYNGYNGFPAGTNKQIGYFEDIVNNTVLYCMYNSNGAHGIYRYYPGKTDVANPLGIVEQVMQYNFGWQPAERITSFEYFPATNGDLLYWTDSQGLHNINLDRANVVNKQKSWKIYMVEATLTQAFFTVLFTQFNGTRIFTEQIGVAGHNADLPTFLAYVTLILNGTGKVTATTCDCYIEVTEINTDGWKLTIPAGVGLVVPDNWYGTNLGDILFARAIAPFLYAPKLTYEADATYPLNNVNNKVFQSALQLLISDGQQSVLSVASQIPINNLECNGGTNILLNYVDINFNNPDFIANLPLWLVVIQQINIVVREHNIGVWKVVDTLYPCDFLDYANGAFLCHYKFYNDTNASPLDTTFSTALDSGVPILADSSNTIFNRGIMGGITQGRNAPDSLQADYSIQISDATERPVHSIGITIRIFNPYQSDADQSFVVSSNLPSQRKYFGAEPGLYLRRGMVCKDITRVAPAVLGTYYGGQQVTAALGNNFTIKGGMEDVYDQRLASDGFVAYLANTDIVAISTQPLEFNGIATNLPTIANGVVVADAGTLSTIASFYLESDPTKVNTPQYDYNDIHSVLTFNNVPDGTYVVRLCSNWCGYGDPLQKGPIYDLANGREYQKTSMPVYGTNVFKNGGFVGFSAYKEIEVTVNGGDVYAGEFVVLDMADSIAQIGTYNNHGIGYLFDNEGNTDPILLKNGNSVELATVEIIQGSWKNAGGTNYDLTQQVPLTNEGMLSVNGATYANLTDHNGFFYYCRMQDASDTAIPGVILIDSHGTSGTLMRQLNSPFYAGSLNDFYLGTITGVTVPISANSSGTLYTVTAPSDTFSNTKLTTLEQFITPTFTVLARLNNSTYIKGRVVDTASQPIYNASVVLANGKGVNTDIYGQYEIVAWGDTLSNGTLGITNERSGDLIFSLGELCFATYPNGQIEQVGINPFGGNLGNTAPPFSPTAIYTVVDFIINELVFATKVAQKRGGKKKYGLRYCDVAGRVCSVVLGFTAYTPFETEDLSLNPHVINPATNLPYTTPTVLNGQPTLFWSLAVNSAPPQEAAYYQWMWTLDGIYKTELQWIINSIQYVSAFANPSVSLPAINTSYANANYIGALISISNLVTYLQENPLSQIGYTYSPGDRLRLIADRNQVTINTPGVYPYVQGIYDYEITGQDASGNLIVNLPLLPFEVQSGFKIEIYSPATLASSTTQIFYEVGEVYKCTNPGEPNNAHSVLSAAFTSGDTYWRNRSITVADTITSYNSVYIALVEAPQISDFYSSTDSSINPTRIGIIDPTLKQIYYRDRLIVSDQFQEGTAYNGLNFCVATNTSDLGAQLGNVARLIVIGKVLHAIMRNSNVSNYVGVVSLQYAQATSTVEAISSNFLGTQYPGLENIGTDWPATVQTIDSYIFGFFETRKNVWRFAQDGIIEISRNEYTDAENNKRTRMVTFFQNLCSTGVWDAVAIYDKHYREYILTVWQNAVETGTFFGAGVPGAALPFSYCFNGLDVTNFTPGQIVTVKFRDNVTGIYTTIDATVVVIGGNTVCFNFGTDAYNLTQGKSTAQFTYKGQGTTVAWNEDKKRWVTRYPFTPDGYASLGDSIYSFVGNTLHVHDVNPVRNNFYGIQYNTMVTPIFNAKPEWYKIWNSCILLTSQSDGNNDWQVTSVTNNNGQQSIIAKGVFTKSGENWYTPFFRDLNDLTVVPALRLSQGRFLRSSSLTCVLVNDATVAMTIYGWVANWTLSQRTSS